MRRAIITLALATVFSAAPVQAEDEALITIGLTTSQSEVERLNNVAANLKEALQARGVPDSGIRILKEKLRRDDVLTALEETAKRTDGDDTVYLILLGSSGESKGQTPAYQVRGPRLTAPELQKALQAIPAQKKVLIGTNRAGPFLEHLKLPDADVLAATATGRQIDAPRFPRHFAEFLKQDPELGWKEAAAQAAQTTQDEYDKYSLARAEESRLWAGAEGKILAPPFGVDTEGTVARRPRGGPGSIVLASDIEIPKAETESLFEEQPPSEENKKLLAEAAAQAKDGYPATFLRHEIDATIDPDLSLTFVEAIRVYVATAQGAERYGEYSLPMRLGPGGGQFLAARIIRPDGSASILDPEKLQPAIFVENACSALPQMLRLPGCQAGSLVEVKYKIQDRTDAQLPAYYREFPLQRDVPVLFTSARVSTPDSKPFHRLLANNDTPPEESESEHARTFTWELDELPAFEGLPYDPPAREVTQWLGVSSFKSWDEFTSWYHNLTRGADEISPQVEAKAKEIAAAHASREERLRAAYEYVSGLRYVAIEIGIGGLRPRTPAETMANQYGDCKDKSNLLVALLKLMDIEAHIALVNRGNYTDTAFPGWQFNHAITYVPAAGGGTPLWLDPTDGTMPFGFLTPGNVGRQALVISGSKADFQEVMPVEMSASQITENWEFRPGTQPGLWEGSFHDVRQGLADYQLRTQWKSLGPQQSDFFLARHVALSLPGAMVKPESVSDPLELGTPMELNANLATHAFPLPNAPQLAELASAFALEERDRPLELNDRQPLKILQLVRWKQVKAAKLPDVFEAAAPGVTFRLAYQPEGDGTVKRVATAHWQKPVIPAEDYPKVRQAFLDWLAALRQNPFTP